MSFVESQPTFQRNVSISGPISREDYMSLCLKKTYLFIAAAATSSYSIKIHHKEVSCSDMHRIELARSTLDDQRSGFAFIDL